VGELGEKGVKKTQKKKTGGINPCWRGRAGISRGGGRVPDARGVEERG